MKPIHTLVFFLCTNVLLGQYQMENLDRGLVAIRDGNTNLISWRILGTDPGSVEFNLYRNGNRINSETIIERSNYRDNSGTITDEYHVEVIHSGEITPRACCCLVRSISGNTFKSASWRKQRKWKL